MRYETCVRAHSCRHTWMQNEQTAEPMNAIDTTQTSEGKKERKKEKVTTKNERKIRKFIVRLFLGFPINALSWSVVLSWPTPIFFCLPNTQWHVSVVEDNKMKCISSIRLEMKPATQFTMTYSEVWWLVPLQKCMTSDRK